MAKTLLDPFAVFANNEVKTAKIEALNGAEIQYRELTMAENDAFTKRLIKNYGKGDGQEAEIDFEAASEIKYEKAALIIMGPTTYTVDQFKAMGVGATAAINEINSLLDDADSDEVDSED